MRWICLLFVAGTAFAAEPKPLVIPTDKSWRSSDKMSDGWQTQPFDDSDWSGVRISKGTDNGEVCTTSQNLFGQQIPADWIWSKAESQGVLRKTFQVPAEVRSAEILFASSDIAVVYLNGMRLSRYSFQVDEWGHRGCAHLHDVTAYIVPGSVNVLAVRLDRHEGQHGFAAELRINGDGFISEHLRKGPSKPKPEAVDKTTSLVKLCDDPSFTAREKSTRELISLLKKEGPSLYRTLEDLQDSASLEQEWRIKRVWMTLQRDRLSAAKGKDIEPRLSYPMLGKTELDDILKASGDKRTLTYRHLMQLRTERIEDRRSFDEAFRNRFKDTSTYQRAELIHAMAFLNWTELADVLDTKRAKVLSDEEGAAIAVAYGKMDALELTKDRLDWLKMAKTSKHEPTARAATAALLNRGGK
jgi:hypothetical protein